MRHLRLGAAIFLCSLFAAGCTSMKPRPTPLTMMALTRQAGDDEILKILANVPWGKDMGAGLSSLHGWKDTGQAAVLFMPDRIVAATAVSKPTDTRPDVQSLEAGLDRETPAPGDRPTFMRDTARAPATSLRVEMVTSFADDGSARLSVVGRQKKLDLFSPKLEVSAVEARIGKPESTEVVLVPSESDSRPTVLTVRRYAGGAISFVSVDPAPRPGRVGRVMMNVEAVRKAIYGE